MKILMLSYEFPPLGGGGSKVVHGLSSELVRQGHAVDLVTMHYRGLPRREVVNGVRVQRVPCVRRSLSICSAPEMATYHLSALIAVGRRRDYDLNHSHFIFPDGLVSLMARRRLGLPFVITAHGSDVPGYNPDRFKLLHRLLAPLWRQVARSAGEIVCPSESIRSLISRQPVPARTSVIPNGFDVGRLRADRPRRKRILAVSRLFERKGIQFLVEAVRDLDPTWELHVVGDGPYAPTLRGLARDTNSRARFYGWLDNDSAELRELYETSSIFVLPSAVENFPVVLLEAMAAGLAIVTIEGTGSAEVVGDSGLLAQAHDVGSLRSALRRLVGNAELRDGLGRRGRRRLEERYSWAAVTRRYVRLYETHAFPGN